MGYGLSRGTALTTWLHLTVQRLAGASADADAPPVQMIDLRRLPDSHRIDLRLMTTDLEDRRPVTFPTTGRDGYHFRLDELAPLFPAQVVEHLRRTTDPDPDGFRELPTTGLPVVVAARISAAFPGLLCAVPLHRKRADGTFRRHHLLDGGASSNFPFHFFDEWLPRRPTFGFSVRRDEPGVANLTDPVPTTTASSWARGLVDAALDSADNAEMVLPGYRERVVDIALRAGTGGIHLLPDEQDLGYMFQQGRQAVTDFLDERSPGRFDMARHAQDRYRLLNELLQLNIQPTERHDHLASSSLFDVLASPSRDHLLAGGLGREMMATEELIGLVNRWTPFGGVDFVGDGAGTHDATLRITFR